MTPAQRIKAFINAKDDSERMNLAIAVYQVAPHWRHYVLKKNQGRNKPMTETAKHNPYASAFCAVISPMTYGSFDYGDTYLRDFLHGVCLKPEQE